MGHWTWWRDLRTTGGDRWAETRTLARSGRGGIQRDRHAVGHSDSAMRAAASRPRTLGFVNSRTTEW
jgi:hypothetical protein